MKYIIIVMAMFPTFAMSENLTQSWDYTALKNGHIYVGTTDCAWQINVNPRAASVSVRKVNNPITGVPCRNRSVSDVHRCEGSICWTDQTGNAFPNIDSILNVKSDGSFELSFGYCYHESNSSKLKCSDSSELGEIWKPTEFISNPTPWAFDGKAISHACTKKIEENILAEAEQNVLQECATYSNNCHIDKSKSKLYSEPAYLRCTAFARATSK